MSNEDSTELVAAVAELAEESDAYTPTVKIRASNGWSCEVFVDTDGVVRRSLGTIQNLSRHPKLEYDRDDEEVVEWRREGKEEVKAIMEQLTEYGFEVDTETITR